MADSTIRISLHGDMPSGTIELNKLATFSEHFQNAVDEMAYSLERNRGSKSERKQITYETKLSLTGIEAGSTDLLINPTYQDATPIYPNLVEDSVEHIVDGITLIRSYNFSLDELPVLPSGWDESVVQKLYDLGKVFRQGVNEIDVSVTRNQQTKTAKYDQPIRAKLHRLLSENRERIESVTGQLLLVNFKENKEEDFACRIYTDVGSTNFILCYFDEELSEEIERAVRKTVGVIGIATYDSISKETKKLHIKELLVHELGTDLNDFDRKVSEALRNYRLENDTLSGLEIAWKQVIAGDTHDISTLWDDFDDE